MRNAGLPGLSLFSEERGVLMRDVVFFKSFVAGVAKAEDNVAVLRVSLTPSAATAGSPIQTSSEVIGVGKTRSTSGLAVSPSGEWLVATAGHKAYVCQTADIKAGFTKFVSPERLTCLAFHPSEEYFWRDTRWTTSMTNSMSIMAYRCLRCGRRHHQFHPAQGSLH